MNVVLYSHRNAVKNRKFRGELIAIITEAGSEGGCDKAQGALLYTAASKVRQLAHACACGLVGKCM